MAYIIRERWWCPECKTGNSVVAYAGEPTAAVDTRRRLAHFLLSPGCPSREFGLRAHSQIEVKQIERLYRVACGRV